MSTNDQRGYLSFTERLKITCTITTREPLHIGSGKKPGRIHSIDQPIIVDRFGRPIIPGSTIKGFLRNYLAVQLLSLKRAGKPVEVSIDNISVRIDTSNIDEENIIEPERITITAEDLDKLDPLLKIFGSPVFSSLIKITEASLPENVEPTISTRTHVSIDIKTGAKKGRALVTLEYVPKDTSFYFTIYFDKLEDERFKDANKLFLILLQQLSRGIRDFIGGWKSRGYGLVDIKCDKIERLKIDEMFAGGEYSEVDLETLVREWVGGADQ